MPICTALQTFQLRAYVYQARSLIGSDASGLSDPFARVIIREYIETTQVQYKTSYYCVPCECMSIQLNVSELSILGHR